MTLSELSRIPSAHAGILAPGKWFRWRALSWASALFVFAALVFVASLQLPEWLSLSVVSGYWIGIILPLAGLAVYGLAVKLCEQRRPNEIALRHAPRYFLLGGLVGFAFMALSLLLLWLFGLNDVSRGHWHDAFHYLVFNAYISAVVEELAFRAILLRIFARMFGPLPGLLISAVLFAAAHASHAPPLALVLLVINGGLLMGVLYMISGSLWLPIGAHIAYDFTEWSLFGVGDTDGYLVVTPSTAHAAWLTGGATGPDGSVLSALVTCVLIVMVVLVARTHSLKQT
ncbi:type II CAAX endopeptidase family protein [Rhodanobacter sp. C05]|uniref:CPBP family intramembrane glutamic endopeptidase n=1 Tax=Rhodanobacter sp. C05 TaxID=1945855 RepID=UPI00117A1FA1|nr:type II CAAX endopeptidase family protein [Rhodanobacter sp. C05]